MSIATVPTVSDVVAQFNCAAEHATLLQTVTSDLVDHGHELTVEHRDRLVGIACALEHLAAVLHQQAERLDVSGAEIINARQGR